MDYNFLFEAVEEDRISVRKSDLQAHSTDWGTAAEMAAKPDVVVWPMTVDEIQEILSGATEHEVPVTPYAAGTSLEGNPVPIAGGISLDMSAMNSVIDIRPGDFQIDVQPGLIGSKINEEVAQHGLFFPPLPSSGKISTIGGMIANDASGMQTVKYGEVHDWVLRLEAVLADGTIIETGSRTVKTSSGYNLMDLLVGSEGTLAVITEATVRLAGLPDEMRGGMVIFEELTDAAGAITEVIQSGIDVARLELIDDLSARMTNDYLGTDFPDQPMLFVEFHANHGIDEEIEFFKSVISVHNPASVDVSLAGPDLEEMWQTREQMADALAPFDSDLEPLVPGDITVPISSFTTVIERIQSLMEIHDLLIPCFGHAGDGNVHYTVMVDRTDLDQLALSRRINEEIVRFALSLGGTATGEHGIGIGKQQYLSEEFNDRTVELMRSVKRAFDPAGILNPGKILPPTGQ